MQLTGKAKEDFEKWYINECHDATILCQNFRDLHPSMQWGVLVDFFDGADIRIEIQVKVEPTMQGARFMSYRPELLIRGRFVGCGASFPERRRAREAAILKACELYNEKHK